MFTAWDRAILSKTVVLSLLHRTGRGAFQIFRPLERAADGGGYSKHAAKSSKSLHRLSETLPEQNLEVAIDIHRRVSQLLTLLPGSSYDRSRIEIEEVLDEY